MDNTSSKENIKFKKLFSGVDKKIEVIYLWRIGRQLVYGSIAKEFNTKL